MVLRNPEAYFASVVSLVSRILSATKLHHFSLIEYWNEGLLGLDLAAHSCNVRAGNDCGCGSSSPSLFTTRLLELLRMSFPSTDGNDGRQRSILKGNKFALSPKLPPKKVPNFPRHKGKKKKSRVRDLRGIHEEF